MKTVLAIDTSTLHASVALVAGAPGDSQVLAESQSGVATHSERLLVQVDEVLVHADKTLADLDGIAIGAGPGSFTGLRIGMATAKGLAFATGKPLWAVSSLAALALEVGPDAGAEALVVPVMDARRGEVFAGFYRVGKDEVIALASERVLAPEALSKELQGVLAETSYTRAVALGDGLVVHAEPLAVDGEQLLGGALAIVPNAPATPPARAVGRLALGDEHPDVSAHGAPAYIRLSEAEIKFPHGNPGGAFAKRK